VPSEKLIESDEKLDFSDANGEKPKILY
jgi:hypothetical protein